MPNIASLLKSEITRLARKEVRAETESLKKSASQHRTEIAALKRQVRELERLLRAAQRSAGRAAARAPQADEGEDGPRRRFRAGGLAAHRRRLGLSAADFGKLIGVSGQTVYSWESGKSRPRASQLPRVAEVRTLGRRAAAERLQAAG